MNSGRGELTLFTSASCFIKISSVFSFPDTVVTAESVSIDEDSERLPSVLLELGGVLLSRALVFCLCPAGDENVGFWLTLSLTKPLEGSISAYERGILSPYGAQLPGGLTSGRMKHLSILPFKSRLVLAWYPGFSSFALPITLFIAALRALW